MPNIPDITPDIDLSLEEAVNLLLTSIAMEEISLSKLMDAESEKINYVAKRQDCGRCNTDDLLSVNDSVNATMINMIKLQMLLQFKLEKVEKLLPPKTPCPPPHEVCCVVGRACGCTCCSCDGLSCLEATLCVCIAGGGKRNDNFLCYTAKTQASLITMNAYKHSLCVRSFGQGELSGVTITGSGEAGIPHPCGQKRTESVDFCITIWNSQFREGFQVVLHSCEPLLNHDSGFVAVRGDKFRIDCSSGCMECDTDKINPARYTF